MSKTFLNSFSPFVVMSNYLNQRFSCHIPQFLIYLKCFLNTVKTIHINSTSNQESLSFLNLHNLIKSKLSNSSDLLCFNLDDNFSTRKQINIFKTRG